MIVFIYKVEHIFKEQAVRRSALNGSNNSPVCFQDTVTLILRIQIVQINLKQPVYMDIQLELQQKPDNAGLHIHKQLYDGTL
jgi:hypothetical protein